MRILALVFGILGTLSAGFLGLRWLSDAHKSQEIIASASRAGVDTSAISQMVAASYLLIVASAAGIAGSVLALKRKRAPAAGTLIVAAIAPTVLAPKALVFTFFLLVGGLLSLGVKPKPAPTPTPA